MKEFNVEYVLNHCRSGGMLSKAVSHCLRIWLLFHVVTVQVPCTARSRWLSSAQWLFLAMIYLVRTTVRSDSLEFLDKSWLTFSLFRRFTEIDVKLLV